MLSLLVYPWDRLDRDTIQNRPGRGALEPQDIYQFAVAYSPVRKAIAGGKVLWQGFGFEGNTGTFTRTHPGYKLSEPMLRKAT